VTLRDQYEADRALWLGSELPWVQSVTYNGAAVSASFQIKTEETAEGRRQVAEIIVSAADVAAPAYRDAVVIAGETWRVLRTISSDTYSHRLELLRDEAPGWGR
jgi:hypothetical protein